MIPFPSTALATDWWSIYVQRPCSVLVDFTCIGKGLQRREIYRDTRGIWIIGFPDVRRVYAAR